MSLQHQLNSTVDYDSDACAGDPCHVIVHQGASCRGRGALDTLIAPLARYSNIHIGFKKHQNRGFYCQNMKHFLGTGHFLLPGYHHSQWTGEYPLPTPSFTQPPALFCLPPK